MKYYSLLFVFALLSGGCVSNAAKTEKSEAAVDSPTVVAGETTDKSAVETPDVDPEKEAEAKIAFVEKFYAEWDDILNYNSLIPYITPKLRKWLSENYDYDCEGECLATWLFFYEGGGDCGALLSRQVKVQDADHILVQNKYDNYEYDVLLTVIKQGDSYKIDELKQIRSVYKDE